MNVYFYVMSLCLKFQPVEKFNSRAFSAIWKARLERVVLSWRNSKVLESKSEAEIGIFLRVLRRLIVMIYLITHGFERVLVTNLFSQRENLDLEICRLEILNKTIINTPMKI